MTAEVSDRSATDAQPSAIAKQRLLLLARDEYAGVVGDLIVVSAEVLRGVGALALFQGAARIADWLGDRPLLGGLVGLVPLLETIAMLVFLAIVIVRVVYRLTQLKRGRM